MSVSKKIWPAVGWAAVIFVTSCSVVTTRQLAHAVSVGVHGKVAEPDFARFWGSVWWLFVKGWHALEFAVLYVLARNALPVHALWLSLSYAVLDEFHQLFVPARGSRLSDMCIDALGILAAWYLTNAPRHTKAWVKVVFFFLMVLLIFELSMYPFGLIELRGGTQSTGP